MAGQRDPEGPKAGDAMGRAAEGSRVKTTTDPIGKPSVSAAVTEGGVVRKGRSTGRTSLFARLSLLESLLETDDPTRCAERAIDWLCDTGGVKQAMCAVIEPERPRFMVVAARGLTPSAPSELAIDLTDRSHPLVSLLSRGDALVFRRETACDPPRAFFMNGAFMAASLSGDSAHMRELRAGLVLTNAVSTRAADDVRWTARALGLSLSRLQAGGSSSRAYELDLKVRAATAALIQQNEILNQQNELLNQQRLALEQASSLKSQFLANVSHEFRTPLNAILGYTSMLLQGMGGDLNAQQAQMLSRVDSNGRNLLSLINDILDISRIEAGKMPIHFAEFRVNDVVVELMSELEPAIARSKLQVTTELMETPALRSDRQKVKQILLNVIMNAIKFTPKGSVTIATSYNPDLRQVKVAVTDTGIGISEHDQEKLFNDFQQADSSPTRPYGGAGLGLSICRRLASMLGGHITLTSKPEVGSTFTLVLPRQARHR